MRISYHDDEVLGRKEVFVKDNFTKADSLGKELLLLESASVSTVKSLQTEMMQIMNSYESSSPRGDSVVKNEVACVGGKKQPDKKDKMGVEQAMRVKDECLHVVELGLDFSANNIQSKLDQEKYSLSQLHQDNVHRNQAEVSLRVELLEKTLLEHHSYAIKKYQELERKLDEDVRIASLRE